MLKSCLLSFCVPNAICPRARLGESLQGGLLAGRKLTLISAPAGYGKTTLAADWAQQTGLPVAWLSLDEQDNEFGHFLAYLLLALRQIADGAGAQIRLILDSPQLPPVEDIAVGLCDDLARLGESNGRFLLALDDYHKIRHLLIHDLLNRLLEHLPPPCHLLLLSREDPPLPLPRLRVRGELTEIRAQDLRFTVTEAEQFFNQAMRLGLSPDWVAELETRTEGWIASLQLAALSLHGRDAAQTEAFIRAFGGSHRYVFDYLAEEVLGQQPEEIREFLRATAVLDRFNASLCHALTGRADSQAILHQLEQANLFLVPLDDARHWYRYHHLFADYLNTLLTTPEKTQLLKAASEWHAANHLPLEAVRYAFASADFAFTAAVLEQILRHDTTWSSFDLGLFSSWLDALPPHVLQGHPELNLNAARIFYLSRRFDLAEKADRSGRASDRGDDGNARNGAITGVGHPLSWFHSLSTRRFPAGHRALHSCPGKASS
jgi:LuxR family transcriptional regulator, maltose regulon positive regulatory protein